MLRLRIVKNLTFILKYPRLFFQYICEKLEKVFCISDP